PWPGCPTALALYPMSVRRPPDLPPASSPPRIAATQLPSAIGSAPCGPKRTCTSKFTAMRGTPWFERHRSTPITEIPGHWPADYRAVVELRIAIIESDPNIGLVERPEYKRRWSMPPWEEMEKLALRGWLLDRLEEPRMWPADDPWLVSTRQLADAA